MVLAQSLDLLAAFRAFMEFCAPTSYQSSDTLRKRAATLLNRPDLLRDDQLVLDLLTTTTHYTLVQGKSSPALEELFPFR
jgi:hypothetical protein